MKLTLFILLIAGCCLLLISCDTVEPIKSKGNWIGTVAGNEVVIEVNGRTSVICYDDNELTFLDVYNDGAFIKDRSTGTFEYTYTISGDTMSGMLDVVTVHYNIHETAKFVRQ